MCELINDKVQQIPTSASYSSSSMLKGVALSCTWGSINDMIPKYFHLDFLQPSAPLFMALSFP